LTIFDPNQTHKTMKKSLLIALLLLLVGTLSMQAQNVIQLPTPLKDNPTTLVQALQQRRSTRQFSDAPISDQVLSDLLWAACGVNRPDEGKLTVPSAMNRQDVEIYVCRADGVWLYNAKENSLLKKSDSDLRKTMGRGPQTKPEAPIILILASDKKKFEMIDRDFCDLDAGYVSQNIGLACAAMGLGSVARAGMNREMLKKELGLTDTQVVILNHPIGYLK